MNSFPQNKALAAIFVHKRLVFTGVFLFFVGLFWVFVVEANTAYAANCTSAGSGNWTEITWTNCEGNPGGDPISTDTVTIANGHAVTLDTNATIAGLTITPTSANSSLTHSGSNSLTVNGTVTLNQGTNANITSAWNVNAGTGTATGLLTMNGNSTAAGRTVSLVITSGTVNLDAGLSTGSFGLGNKILDMSGGAGTLNLKGNITGPTYLNFVSGTSGSTVNYADTVSTQTVYSTFNTGGHHNIRVSNTTASGAQFASGFTTSNFTGDLTVVDGALMQCSCSITAGTGQDFIMEGSSVLQITSSTYLAGFDNYTYSTNSVQRYVINSYPTIPAGNYSNLELKPTVSYYTYTLAAGTFNISGNFTIGNGAAILYAYASTNDPVINVGGSFIISTSSQFFASDLATLTVGDDFTISGYFAHTNGTIEFNDSSKVTTVTGTSLIFYDLIVDTPNKSVQFEATRTFRFQGDFTAIGTSGNLVSISSSVGASQWLVDFDTTQTTFDWDYVSLQDSGCGSGTLSRTLIHSNNVSNNNSSCWTFLDSMTISGNVYNTKANAIWTGAGKCDGSTQSIALSINGGAKQTTTCDAGTGAYSFSVDPASSVIVAVWLDTAGGDSGVVYTRTAITNVTSLHLYRNQVRVRYESGSSITNANINVYDNSNDSDIPVASDGVAATISAGVQLTVLGSMSYAPGGNVTTPALEVLGTYSGATETLTITGSGTSSSCSSEPGTMMPICVNGGRFDVSSNTVDFTTTSATNIPNLFYYNVRFVPTSGSPTYTLGTANNQSLSANNVVMGNGTNAVTINGSTYSFAIHANTLTVAASASYDAGAGIVAVYGNTNPITANGTFDYDSATLVYGSKGDFTVPAGTYFNLQLAPGLADSTLTLASGTFTVNNNLIIGSEGAFGGTVNAAANNPTITVAGDVIINQAAVFNAPSTTLTVSGNWSNYGEFNGGSGTVEMNATTNRTLSGALTAGGKFNNLVLSGSGGIWTASGDVEVNGDLTVTAGTFSGAGNLTVNGGDISGTGTVMFSGNTHMVNIAQMSAGDFHTCAVNVIGDVYCWGSASYGVLGDGQSSTQRTNPVRVLAGGAVGSDTDGTYLTNIKYVKAGTFNTCAVSYAGNAYCWGWANNGQVGDNQTATQRTSPVRVHDGAATGADSDGTYLINIDQIDIELYHACALSFAGKMYCWGNADYGAVGDGQTSSDRLTPVLVQDGAATGADTDGTYLANVKKIMTGYELTCTINFSGATYCWGYAGNGSVGDGQTASNRSTPVRVQDGEATGADTDGTYLVNLAEIDSSNYAVCAIAESSNTYCWGQANSGQLGDNQTNTNRTTPVRVHDGAAVGADTDGTYLINLKQISVGSVHTCALANSGYTYCWGNTAFGTLGDGLVHGSGTFSVPKLVLDGEATGGDSDGTYLINQSMITTGQYHACTISYSDVAYCWGSLGQIGWTSQNSSNPTAGKVQSRTTNFAQVITSDSHTCGITTSTEVYCWGSNSSGRLGIGSENPVYVPTQVLAGAAVGSDTDGTYLRNVKQLSSTSSHACAVTYSTHLYCWGNAGQGQVGDGQTASNRTSPVRVHDGVASGPDTDGTYLTNIKQVSTGILHTCAISYSEKVYCWGYANYGLLGDNQTSTNRTTPIQVHDGVATGSDTDGTYLINIGQIESGWYHTCAVSNAGKTYCWGETANGQLGDNQTSTDRLTPVQIEDGVATGMDSDGTYLTNIKQIDGGGYHTCAVTFSDRMYCWGMGSNGQLGYNGTSQQNTPVAVEDGAAVAIDTDGTYLRNIAKISVGLQHTCVVSRANNPYCFGNGYRFATSNQDNTPVRLSAGAATGSDASGGYLVNAVDIGAGPGSQFGAGQTFVAHKSGNIYGAGCCNASMQGFIGDGSNGQNRLSFVFPVRPASRDTDSSTFTLNGTGNFGGDVNWRLIDLNLGTVTTGTTTATGTGTITIYGDVINSSGHTFNAGGKTYYLYQDFTNQGTFSGASSTLNFQSSHLISRLTGDGTSVFNNITVNTPGKELVFTSGDTFRVDGLLTVTGTEYNPVVFSSSSASQWYINHQGTESISYLDLSYAGCDPGSENIDAYNGTNINSGNNGTCWLFVLAVYHGGGGPTDGGPGSAQNSNGGTSAGPGGPPAEESGPEPGNEENSGTGNGQGSGGGASP